jgi:hypothetical protein
MMLFDPSRVLPGPTAQQLAAADPAGMLKAGAYSASQVTVEWEQPSLRRRPAGLKLAGGKLRTTAITVFI